MKKGQIILASFCDTINTAVTEISCNDDALSKCRVLGFKKYRRHIKLKDNMKIIFTINNASIISRHLKPINSSAYELNKNGMTPISGTQIWEVTNLGSMIRSERAWRKYHSIDSDILGCFIVSENGSESNEIINIFDLAENVKVVDNKWEYELV